MRIIILTLTLTTLFMLFFMLSLSGCAYQTGLNTAGPLSSTDSYNKTRSYNFGYDQVFEAAFNAISKSKLQIVKLDKNMGAIIADEHIGSPLNGWLDHYDIHVKEMKPAETAVQVKLSNLRPGFTYVSLDLFSSPNSASVARIPFESNLKKVNAVFTGVQKELGVEEKFTLRGLLWD